jgi:hypothetical protein
MAHSGRRPLIIDNSTDLEIQVVVSKGRILYQLKALKDWVSEFLEQIQRQEPDRARDIHDIRDCQGFL